MATTQQAKSFVINIGYVVRYRDRVTSVITWDDIISIIVMTLCAAPSF